MNTARTPSSLDWKQRYQDLVEQQDKQQVRYRRKQSLLIDAIVQLVQFGRDLDPAADSKLLAMRSLVRQESIKNVDLAQVVESLEQQLELSLKDRKKQQAGIGRQLSTLVKQVQGLAQQRDLQAELNELKKAFEASPIKLADVASYLGSLSRLHALALKQSKPGMLQRWFGSENANPAKQGGGVEPSANKEPSANREPSANKEPSANREPSANKEPSANNSADQTVFDEHSLSLETISGYLQRLLQEIEPGQDMRGTFEVARDVLAAGLTIENMDLVIQSVTDVVLAAISTDRLEMTGYLAQMNERLQEATLGLSLSQTLLEEEIAVSQDFGKAMEQTVGGMRAEVLAETDLTSLKTCINQSLDRMMTVVEERQSQGASAHSQLSEQLETLVNRAKMLELQGQEAELRVAEQRRRALTDNLTNLPNREAYEEVAAKELQRWQRYGRPLCLAVCDIDLFKTVNDSYGHSAGDEVLRQLAELLGKRLRGTDFVARYGGEEFVVLLPETDREQAERVMDSVREAIASSPITWEKKVLNLTVSIGIADFKGKDILQSAFTRADRALYQAKMNGRNRVQLALD
tara:strand:+ start:5789 stop:7522 length:1734 start_codon:yes stop_codon:yes gene_type:complete